MSLPVTDTIAESGLDRDATMQALLRASQTVNPYQDEPDIEPELQSLVSGILSQAKGELGVEDFSTHKRKVEARSLISGWMSEYAMQDADREQLRDQLGWRGDLDPIYYDIEISEELRRRGPTIGVRPSHVRGALRRPDGHSHFNPDADETEKAVSLFTEHHEKKGFTLLIQGFRDGDKVAAQSAFRVYYDDVKAGRYIRSPKEFLHAFVEKYGLRIEIGDERRKLFWLEEISHPDDPTRTKEVGVEIPGDHEVWHDAILKQTDDEIFVVSGYAIDVDRYRADLRQRGVQISV